MAMTVRLTDEANEAAKRVAEELNVSVNTVINLAVIEYDQKRREVRDAILRMIVGENRELLERLEKEGD